MTVADVTVRIQQIQAQLAVLTPPSTSAADFAAVLGGMPPSTAPTTAPKMAPTTAPSTAPSTATAVPGTDVPEAGATTGGSGVTGEAVIEEAKKYLGVPYVWGGEGPEGMDCSGMIQYVYGKLGIDLPRVSYEQAEAGRPVASLADAQPGDILAFNSPVSHVGLYIGNNKMIEAPRPGLAVRISEIYDTPTAIRRVIPEATASTSLPAGTPFAQLFEQAGSTHGVDPTLLAAVAKQESGYDPGAVSSAGAEGLMQLMPATAAGLGVGDSFDPNQAVDGAARLLKSLLGEFGSTDLALAAYNAGPGAVHRYGGIPPYPETQAYVPAVLAIQALLAGQGAA